MRKAWLIVLLAGCLPLGRAQEATISLDDLMDSAQQWAEENIDPEVLSQLNSADQRKVQQLFRDLQQQLQGEYVVDLAALRDSAKVVLPLLEASEQGRPYAAWLKAQVDYLEVADQLLVKIPPPKSEPDQPPKPRPNPSAQIERQVWIGELKERPWPPAAKQYVTELKPVFTAQGIPGELVWLAEVESGFDPKALSPVGAAGLFQLMPATAKRFGLKLRLPDQRYKPQPSATAAAKYLRALHQRFKDWRLALAAYNAGEGTIQRLMDRYSAKTFDELSPHLPAETQMYVPRYEAVLLRREGKKIEEL
jgi:membrane-bound lytic murein transglycosylase D